MYSVSHIIIGMEKQKASNLSQTGHSGGWWWGLSFVLFMFSALPQQSLNNHQLYPPTHNKKGEGKRVKEMADLKMNCFKN